MKSRDLVAALLLLTALAGHPAARAQIWTGCYTINTPSATGFSNRADLPPPDSFLPHDIFYAAVPTPPKATHGVKTSALVNHVGFVADATFYMLGSGNPGSSHMAIFWHHVPNYDGGYEYGFVRHFSGGIDFYQCGNCNQTGINLNVKTRVASSTLAQKDLHFVVVINTAGNFDVTITRNDNGNVVYSGTIPRASWAPDVWEWNGYLTATTQKFTNADYSGSSLFITSLDYLRWNYSSCDPTR